MSIQDYKQCIDCGKIMLPSEMKLPYGDGPLCLPCYLVYVGHSPKEYSDYQKVQYNLELTTSH